MHIASGGLNIEPESFNRARNTSRLITKSVGLNTYVGLLFD